MPQIITKSPTAVLDYAIDWDQKNWLSSVNDTLETSVWTVQSGITKDSNSNTATVSTIWLSGGTLDTDYEASNHIVTAAGREDDRTITIQVRER